MSLTSEVASRLLFAFNRGSVEEVTGLCDPDVKLTTLFGRVHDAHAQGHEGLRQWLDHIERTWAFIEARVDEVDDRGEWVLVAGSSRGRGRASPSEIAWEWTAAIKVEAGRVVSLGIYLSREEALAAIEER